jgi:hypothetical protein
VGWENHLVDPYVLPPPQYIQNAAQDCQGNINSIPPTQLPHKFSYIVAILGHNDFESPNRYLIHIKKVAILLKTKKKTEKRRK